MRERRVARQVGQNPPTEASGEPLFTHFEYVGAPVKADVGWQAWVVYVAEDDEATTAQQWVSQHLVRPA